MFTTTCKKLFCVTCCILSLSDTIILCYIAGEEEVHGLMRKRKGYIIKTK